MAEGGNQAKAFARERTFWIVMVVLAFAIGLSQGGRQHGPDPYEGLQDNEPLFPG